MYEYYSELRDKAGLTDYEVAKRTGLTTAQFSNWKAGRYSPKADKLLLIARLLEVSVEELITGGKPDCIYQSNTK